MLDIVTYGDEVLTQKAEAIKDFGPEVAELVAGMFEAMRRGKGIGLAGPQVGKSLRVFVTQVEGDKPRAFINPEIVLTSQEEVEFEEGCLSLPGLYLGLRRPEFVRVQAWNEKGRPFTTETGGLLARVLLHEYDHLDGILFIDRLNPARRERALGQYQRLIRM
ncbi:MAG TPA: peptide deformylase [Rectinemataceae bacterium]|nr:peptide deformylase [Rectinemataceae bacterium]